MAEETVTVGDTEVEIRETEDGFEAVEADGSVDEPVIRAESTNSPPYGFEIPLSKVSDALVIEYKGADHYKNPYRAAWDTDADVGDMRSSGSAHDLTTGTLDGHAVVKEPEIVFPNE